MNGLIIVLLCIVSSESVLGQKEGESCVAGDKTNGVCTVMSECIPAQENLKKNIFPKICSFNRLITFVCCADPPANETIVESITEARISVNDNDNMSATNVTAETRMTVLNNKNNRGEISKAKCKEYAKYSYKTIFSPVLSTKPQFDKSYECNVNREILTIGTLEVNRKEIPHMALIGFDNVGPVNKTLYLCGGSLISEHFVLTSSSCYEYYLVPPRVVLLGVTHIHAQENRQEINIAKFFVHPEYDNETGYHDVGLVKLEKPVELNSYVRPACLNTVKDIKYNTGVIFEWGLKHFFEETNDVLKSILNIISNEDCQTSLNRFGDISQKINDDLMICATIISNQRNDPCENAVGGSLQILNQNSQEFKCTSLIIGVTSSLVYCGVESPEIFTRVSTEIEWIESIVWPHLKAATV